MSVNNIKSTTGKHADNCVKDDQVPFVGYPNVIHTNTCLVNSFWAVRYTLFYFLYICTLANISYDYLG